MNEVYMLHTIGGGDTLWTTFNAIASLLRPDGGSLLKSMVFMGTIIGVLSAIAYTVFKNELAHVGKWYLSSQVIILGLLTPVSTLHIHDHMTGFNKSVDNVPFALAFLASHLSSLGSEITQKIETVFQPSPHYQGGDPRLAPTDSQLRYSQTGFMFASHVMMQMKGVQLTNEDMMDNLEEYVNQCVVYDALIGKKYTMHDLKHSDDLWGLVTTNASQMRGFAYRDVIRDETGRFAGSNGTQIITCKEGARRFNAMWTQANQSIIRQFTDKLRGHLGFSHDQQTSLGDQLATYLPGAMQKITKLSGDASRHLKQQVMISAILKGNEKKNIELGGSPNLDVRRAYLQQQTTYQTIGQTIAQTLPSLKNTIECLAYALFIFVVFLSLLPRGSRVFLFYMKLLLWLQLWPPLFSVLNFIMTENMSSAMVTALKTANGITIGNMVGLANMANDMSATAGYLCSMIPVLSWALIEQGGYAFVSMASGILGVSQSAASAAAAEKVSGNYNAGNVAMDGYQLANKSAFKTDFAPSYADGFIATNTGLISSTHGADGETIIHRNESQLPVSITAHNARENILNEALQNSTAVEKHANESAQQSWKDSLNSYVEFGRLSSNQRASGESYANDETAQISNEAADFYEKVKNISDSKGISEAEVLEQYMGGDIGIGVQLGPVNFGFGAGIKNSLSNSEHAEESEQSQNVKQNQFREQISKLDQAVKNNTFHIDNQETKQLVEHTASSYEDALSFERTASKAHTLSDSIRDEQSFNQSNGMRVDTRLTQDAVNKIGADKIARMSTHELNTAMSGYAQNHLADYQQKFTRQLDHLKEGQRLKSQYDNHQLPFGREDVKDLNRTSGDSLRRQGKEELTKVDESARDRANTFLVTNNGHVQQQKQIVKDAYNLRKERKEFDDAQRKSMKESPAKGTGILLNPDIENFQENVEKTLGKFSPYPSKPMEA